MNAIISLCHFCEVHGPVVLFCTQAFHSAQPPPDEPCSRDGGRESPDEAAGGGGYSSQGPSSWTGPGAWTSGSGSWNNGSAAWNNGGCAMYSSGPASWNAEVFPDKTSERREVSGSNVAALRPKPESCERCRSLSPDLPGYVSTDAESRVSYVSSQFPQHPEVYRIVRQACLRSLCCEVCPGRDGPMFFGDDQRSQVLSHTFVVPDPGARGLQRRYSIVVVMMDKIFLLNSWPFLVHHLRRIIDQIKAKVDALSTDDLKQRCAQLMRLPHAGGAPSLSGLKRQARPHTRTMTSLGDITGDAEIFAKLHGVFARILAAGASRLTERLLEGPPTDDSVIDLDRLEDTDEGFVKLYRRVGGGGVEEAVGNSPSDEEEKEDALLRPVQVFTSLRMLLQVLKYSDFHKIAHHVIRGNQVIVRAQQRSLVRSVIDCLKTLLPKGCCHVIYFARRYDDFHRSNIVGMSLHVPLPDPLPSGAAPPGVILEISDPRLGRLDGSLSAAQPLSESMFESKGGGGGSEGQIAELKSRHYHVYSPAGVTLPGTEPTVLSKMMKALLSEQLADSVVDQSIACLKEEWMSKVKVVYKFTKLGGNRSKEDTAKLLQIVGAREEDRVVLKFWETGLSTQYISDSCST